MEEKKSEEVIVPELTEEEVVVTKESLAQSIAELVADSTKSDRNQTLNNHAALLRMYARQERQLTDNYSVKNKDDE